MSIISLAEFVTFFLSVTNSHDKFFGTDEDVLGINERYEQSEVQVMFNEPDNEIIFYTDEAVLFVPTVLRRL